ncbi:MAG: M28 family peptidase [Acidimicrobiia bacterium]|nr:M28 family peptidase [Acidimicrobiia bacterium]
MRDPLGADRVEVAERHLVSLCDVAPDRRPGSDGNRVATRYAAEVFRRSGWAVDMPVFDVMDWQTDGGAIRLAGSSVEITPSPYGLGVSTRAPIRVARTTADLEHPELGGSILVLADDIATEPITPKAFPFYRHDEHVAIIDRIEAAAPAAVIGVTGKHPALCGALDPYPLFEDGDFVIPAASIRPADAEPLLGAEGQDAHIDIRSTRWVASAENVIATRGDQRNRITVIAHIDAKPGTPGAVDNAAGVVVLLLLADLLSEERHPTLPIGVELFAVNGEDHYAAPGELDWLAANEDHLDRIALVVNIDGAGYRGAPSAYSLYNVDGDSATRIAESFAGVPSLVSGPEWFQSDHAIFAMRGHPALAMTTELVDEMLDTLFHAPTDTPDQVDVALLVDIAAGLENLITTWPS